ncbi:type II toxin-antitoxin system RelE/ParE family toxin [Botrimarina colliarenosi]|uniref:type II toxin-antitoxin system RelE/ParE family toxin n=1 Tax=Botrimarina colliarenosi TaxID=2528001 RepID=UPI0011B5F229|nr:type II toxin-antitoxin system RelE/ParE family toxin [Botrimarina colliarenosi]
MVTVTEPAQADIRGTIAYLSERSPAGAKAWRKALDGCFERLRTHPETAGHAPEHTLFDEAIRQAIFKTKLGRPYRVIFVVRGETVHVLRVRCPGQDLLGAEGFAE